MLLHTRDLPPAPECTQSLPANSPARLTGLRVRSRLSGEGTGPAQLLFQGLQPRGRAHLLKMDAVAFPLSSTRWDRDLAP